MNNFERRLKKMELGLTSSSTPILMADTGLVLGSHPLSQLLASEFNHNFDAYDTAIDSVYNATRIGGSNYHHLLDGQHSLLSSIHAVKDVKADDSFLTEIAQASEHLLRDVASVSGINPFFTLTGEQFNSIASYCQEFGISKPFLADALTLNGPELIGGCLALTSSLIMGKKADPSLLSNLSGSFLVSSLATANPFLLPVAAGGMAYSIYKAEDKKEALITAGKGAIVSGSAIAVGTVIGGPVWLGCMVGIGTAVAVKYVLNNPEKAFTKVQDLIKPANSIFRKISLQIS
ncbi:hypothetical protein CVD28_18545 [Bacillus sp. M6-12]|uniref:hypothetical protein n=1 Tax=Bacillus sp. M6-12 TaxID=2054166 RepID=UPI000C778BCE|nr:hypothetical protein [Bacillus sp. M6-12]PLS16049.1 hypothetical protein CVD28_18545 [Bacillus sp. M6-12]